MRSRKVNFNNSQGELLAARIELPLDQHPHNFVLFAHCFTCNKNLTAVRNISRALTREGFGVMRFDFTGLGESEGDFADTNFSGNVQDLVTAANYLKDEHLAPSILVGHSLGGAAVVFAAREIPSVKAIATIGSPSDPVHVTKNFEGKLKEIENSGKAEVSLAGRPFTIKKQFVEDLHQQSASEVLARLKLPLLVMHSPQDETVSIENARAIYDGAFHPKSFISLDGADHLLTNAKDSRYVGSVLASWVQRYVDMPEEETLKTDHQVVARLDGEGYATDIQIGRHGIVADEPADIGGNDFGPTPYELLSSALAACTVMTLKMYARRKEWDLQSVEVHIDHDKKHCIDCQDIENKEVKIDIFERSLKLEGNLDEKQIKRLLQIANRCPVHRTLHEPVEVHTNLIE